MRFGNKRMRPRLASDKLGRVVRCDSYLEKDLFIQLDFDPAVVAWRDHPFLIPYFYNGQLHRYVPSALVLRRRNAYLVHQVVEVKATYLLQKNEVARTIEAGERFCMAKGWEYRVATEKQIRSGHLLENIKRIRRYRKQLPVWNIIAIRQALNTMGGRAPIDHLAGAMKNIFMETTVTPCIYSLLYNKELFADLHSPLTRDTVVEIPLARQ